MLIFRFEERDGVVRRQTTFPLVTNSIQTLKQFDKCTNYLILRVTNNISLFFAVFPPLPYVVFCWKVQLSWREKGHLLAHCWLSHTGSMHSPLERGEQWSSPERGRQSRRTPKSVYKCIFPRTGKRYTIKLQR